MTERSMLGATGGCQCGAVRYTINREPKQLIICHCTQCQRRYGAFGMSLFCEDVATHRQQVQLFRAQNGLD